MEDIFWKGQPIGKEHKIPDHPEPDLLYFPEIIHENPLNSKPRERQFPIRPHRYNHVTGKIYGQSMPTFHNRRERRAYHRSLKQNMAVDL